jgi:hypothetical protein
VVWCCVKSLYLVVLGINLREKVYQKPLRVVRDNAASVASEIPRTALKPKGLPPETVGSLVEARSGRFGFSVPRREVIPFWLVRSL